MTDPNAPLTPETTCGLTTDQMAELHRTYWAAYHRQLGPLGANASPIARWGYARGSLARVRDDAAPVALRETNEKPRRRKKGDDAIWLAR